MNSPITIKGLLKDLLRPTKISFSYKDQEAGSFIYWISFVAELNFSGANSAFSGGKIVLIQNL